MPKHIRRVGDTLTPLGAVLLRPDGSPVDLTGLSVKFKMIDSDGYAKVDSEEAVIVDAGSGKVQYDFSPYDVDTPGTYYGYFFIEDLGESEHFPAKSRNFEIELNED